MSDNRIETITCETCGPLLIDRQEGTLPAAQRAAVDRHLDDCSECRMAAENLWIMEASATRWRDVPVPKWHRAMDEPAAAAGWLTSLQLGGVAASLVMLVLVSLQVSVTVGDGVTVTFGGDSYITNEELDERLASETQVISSRIENLGARQAAADQLVMTSLLQASRQERRQDMGQLIDALNLAETSRERRTREALRFLIDTQQEDRRDIEQLNQALALVGNSGETL